MRCFCDLLEVLKNNLKHQTLLKHQFFLSHYRRSGVPDLPEARGKLCAAYDPSGAVIVCGGGERFYRPNSDCWQLVSGLSKWYVILFFFVFCFKVYYYDFPPIKQAEDSTYVSSSWSSHCFLSTKILGSWRCYW